MEPYSARSGGPAAFLEQRVNVFGAEGAAQAAARQRAKPDPQRLRPPPSRSTDQEGVEARRQAGLHEMAFANTLSQSPDKLVKMVVSLSTQYMAY